MYLGISSEGNSKPGLFSARPSSYAFASEGEF